MRKEKQKMKNKEDKNATDAQVNERDITVNQDGKPKRSSFPENIKSMSSTLSTVYMF